MPNYYFKFAEGSSEEQLDVELPDDEQARAEAIRAAREIMAEGIYHGIDRSHWQSTVYSEDGHVVASFRFGELVERRGGLS